MNPKVVLKEMVRGALLLRFHNKLTCGHRPSPRLLWCLHIEQGAQVTIGDDVVIKPGAYIYVGNGGQLEIGNRFFMNRGANITVLRKTCIGNKVLLGPSAMVFDHDHDYSSSNPARSYRFGDITIGNGAWICAGAIVTRGVTVGDGSVVAANAVVCSDVPAHVVVGGVPAEVKKENISRETN